MSVTAAEQLERMLDEWRATYDESLGARIEALGTTLPAIDFDEPAEGSYAARRWCELATDSSAARLTPLLDALESLFERVRGADAARCLELAATRLPDPRVAAFALPYLSRAREVPEYTRRLECALVSALERHGDGRTARALEALADTVPAHTRRRILTAHRRIQSRIADATRHARLPASISSDMRTTGADLLAAIYEDPEDESRRLVYADWLLECDPEDPRGQLIAAQLHREAARAGTGRSAAVKTFDEPNLPRHARAWYAAILPAIQPSSMVFEKGFLARCALVENLKGVPSTIFGRPEWATVRELRAAHGFVYHPTMRALRSLAGVTETQLEELATSPAVMPRLDRLEVVLARQRLDALLALLDRTPVHTLAIVAATSLELTALVTASAKRRFGGELRALEVRGDRPRWGVSRAAPWTTGNWTLPLLERSQLQRLVIARDRWSDSRLELLRDEAGWSRARVHVDETRPGIVAAGRAWLELLRFLTERPIEELAIHCVAPPQLGPEHPVQRIAPRCARIVRTA